MKNRLIILLLIFTFIPAGCITTPPCACSPAWDLYVWPLSGTQTPDEMNTSFGPRINYSKWDFHDGLDLPADPATTTPIYAIGEGTIHKAGDADYDPITNPNGYRSRHIVLKLNDPKDGVLYAVYIHLESIHAAIAEGASVVQGQILGAAGSDGATYKHLHFEIRKGTANQISSVHPLLYLPYTDTPNFTAPVFDRANLKGASMAVRLSFGADNKREGDLKRVEVDLMSGTTFLSTRVVDFNDKTTIKDAIGDEHLYVNDIGVEGYQTSNMVADGRTDLQYGILLRNLPDNCDVLIARVMDTRGNISTSTPISVPVQTSLNLTVDFEDGAMPPSGWAVATSSSGDGTTVANDAGAFHAGTRGLLATDASSTETATQRAGIEMALPLGRFEWKAESWVNPMTLLLENDGQAIYPLYFLNDSNLVAAARIYKSAGTLLAGIAYKKADGATSGVSSETVVSPNTWKKWTLSLLRVGTRETTAVLYLDDVEQDRTSWDPGNAPSAFRSGIGLSSAGGRATVAVDDLLLTE